MEKLGIEHLSAFMEGKDVFFFWLWKITNLCMPYAFDTISLDSLQTRPCNFSLFFLATPTHSGSHHIRKSLQLTDNAMALAFLLSTYLISMHSIATRLPVAPEQVVLRNLTRPFLSLGEVKGRATRDYTLCRVSHQLIHNPTLSLS